MKKDNLKISVIMSTFNTPTEYLKKSIDSILNQSYRNIEFIIVCDGAQKDQDYIINNYKDKRIKLIIHENNKGLPQSLNEAIKCSTGTYIARMDSDDICLKNRLNTQIEFMEKHKDIDICAMYAKCFGNIHNIKGTCYVKPDEISVQLLFMNCLIHPTIMIRKVFLDKEKIRYNEDFKFSQDYELWSRVENKNIRVIRKIGIKYRVHENQVSCAKSDIQKDNRLKVIINKLKKINYCEEKYIYMFMVLASLRKINIYNYKNISESIDCFINDNTSYDKKKLKKILYNRYFQIFINSELIHNKKIIFEREIRKKILNLDNIKYLLFILVNKIKSFIQVNC